MTSHDHLERQLRSWMTSQPTAQDDARLLAAVADRTRDMGQGQGIRARLGRRDLPALRVQGPGARSAARIIAGFAVVAFGMGALFLAAGQAQPRVWTVSPSPVAPDAAHVVSAVDAAGAGFHTCAIVGGRPWCWGWTDWGRADGQSEVVSPTPVVMAGLGRVTAISGAGWWHKECAVTGGRVWCWGDDYTGAASAVPVALEGLEGATAVSVGLFHACAIVDGRVWCWGDDRHGQLGDGRWGEDVRSGRPVLVEGLEGVTDISAGKQSTCAIADGRAWCWGSIPDPATPGGDSATVTAPVAVAGLGHVTEISVGAENGYWCAVADARAWCWGNYRGRQDDGMGLTHAEKKPAMIPGLEGVTAISAGGWSTCAVADGIPWCWGNGKDYGFPAVRIEGIDEVTSISVGDSHACALSRGSAWCWGANDRGQLGDGTTGDSGRVAQRVVGLGASGEQGLVPGQPSPSR
jgi:hypothetical protein